jgi:hypothetical protein
MPARRIRDRQVKTEQLTPEHYFKKDAKLSKGKVVERKHAEATIISMRCIEKYRVK